MWPTLLILCIAAVVVAVIWGCLWQGFSVRYRKVQSGGSDYWKGGGFLYTLYCVNNWLERLVLEAGQRFYKTAIQTHIFKLIYSSCNKFLILLFTDILNYYPFYRRMIWNLKNVSYTRNRSKVRSCLFLKRMFNILLTL